MRGQVGRLAPLTGLVFVGLFIGLFVISGSSPNSDASAAKAVSFFTAHRHGQLASAFLLWYAALFVLFFAAALRSYLRARAGSDGLIALGFVGVGVLAVGMAVVGGSLYAAADVASKISPAAEQALNVLQDDLFPVIFVGLAAFMFGNGLAIVKSKALPQWLGWVAIVIGVLSVAGPIAWFSLFGLLGWTLVASILMYLRQGKPAPAPA